MRSGLLASLFAFMLAMGVAGTAFAGAGLGDTDGDDVDDYFDVCRDVADSPQLDTDGDGCGNICDGDYDNDGDVDGGDFLTFRGGFFASASGDTDHDGDGDTDGADFLKFRGQFFQAVPGPSVAHHRDTTACP